MRFLAVEAVERRVDSELFRANQQFADGGVGRVFDDVLFTGKRFAVFGDGGVVVANEGVGIVFVLMVGLMGYSWDSVFVESYDCAVRMDMRGRIRVFVRMLATILDF